MPCSFPQSFSCKIYVCLTLSVVLGLITSIIGSRDVYHVDDSVGFGRRFDGIGAISGGGATSKLLVTYPAKQRDEVLDYLFKPNFGASLQILKVEIGGDGQSSEGTESSHMHEEWDENYERGYEWFMMVEAKKRNPNIKLYALAWSFPGFLGGKDGNWPYSDSNKTASYIVSWIQGAKQHYKLDVDYVGIWNEKPYTREYVKTLRRLLDSRGFHSVQIVAADLIGGVEWPWSVVFDMEIDQDFNRSVSYVGAHYTGTSSIAEAKSCGKPLWSSEDDSTAADWTGGGCMARIANQNYVNGLMTSTIAWNLVTGYYQHLPYYPSGLMMANSPWSGHYEVRSPIWTAAHTTQFTQIGWQYLQHGHGVGLLRHGGSYVTLVSPDRKELTMVIETMNPKKTNFCLRSQHPYGTQPQNITILFKASLNTAQASFCLHPPVGPYETHAQNVTFLFESSMAKITSLEMWYTKLDPVEQSAVYFKRLPSVKVIDRKLEVNLEVNSVYTLTTIKTGNKGAHGKPPSDKPFPLPYQDNFDSTAQYAEADYFTPQIGSFEVLKSADTKHGMVLRQVVITAPVHWCPTTLLPPIGVIGNYQWADIKVQVDFYVGTVNATTAVFIATRVDQGGCQTFMAKGIFYFVDVETKQWHICEDLECTMGVTSGEAQVARNKWSTLSLTTKGNVTTAELDGKRMFSQELPGKTRNGFVAFGTGHFGLADFDNLIISPA